MSMSPRAEQEIRACVGDPEVTFPDVVARLGAVGVERYTVDLVRAEKTFYQPDGGSLRVDDADGPQAPAVGFAADSVAAAVRTVQAGAIGYDEFCRRIAAAGCVGYCVSLPGQRVVYYGRTGDAHVEWFPGAAP